MNFLEKLSHLMKINRLNKNTLSKGSGIPYTTIDGWYKKGYEGLKLSTLLKLADYFGTTLDYLAHDNEDDLNNSPKPVTGMSAINMELQQRVPDMPDTEALAVLAFIETFETISKQFSGD